MWILLAIAFVYVMIVVIFQGGMVFWYRRWLVNHDTNPLSTHPPVAVVLSLRGEDPSLKRCLRALACQAYENYRVDVIVDHELDPALPIVREQVADDKRFVVRIAQPPAANASLKCDRLAQVVESLPAEYEFVCLIDADAVPDPQWISTLIKPFGNDRVAVVTGNRWFHPRDLQWGSVLRYLWNSAAVVQMAAYRIPWGGSLAIRRSSLDETGLIDRWKTAMYEDVLLKSHFQKHGMLLQPVPDILVPNDEVIDVSGARRWIARQLLDAKLYHRHWPLVFLHSISSGLLWLLLVAGLVASCLTGPPVLVYGFFLLFCGFYSANFLLLYGLEKAAQKSLDIRRRHVELRASSRWLDLGRMLKMFLAILPVQFVHLIETLRVTRMRRVAWRGCYYQIDKPFSVMLEEYVPFTADRREAKATSEPDAASIN